MKHLLHAIVPELILGATPYTFAGIKLLGFQDIDAFMVL
jgi:hypothetical protein